MKTPTKIITALALAGLAIAGGAAFTSGGATVATPSQWVGGAVSQGVTGANITSIVYDFNGDATKTHIHGATVTFANVEALGSAVAIAFTGTPTGAFSCTNVVGTGTLSDLTPWTSVCTTSTPLTGENDAANVTNAQVTVTPHA